MVVNEPPVKAPSDLQLPLRQWVASNVYLLVLGKHCRKPHCRNGVEDHLGLHLQRPYNVIVSHQDLKRPKLQDLFEDLEFLPDGTGSRHLILKQQSSFQLLILELICYQIKLQVNVPLCNQIETKDFDTTLRWLYMGLGICWLGFSFFFG